MATIKSYTALSQSKKLAEILPLESADMRYGYIAPYDYSDRMYDGGYDEVPYPKDFLKRNPNFSENEYDGELPCWSLAALLGVIPILDNRSPILSKTFDRKYRVVYHSTAYEKAIYTEDFDNPVDACVAMIEKLHELKML